MRILMISDVYFPRVNGVSTSIRTYRDSLAALGHEVALIAPDYPERHGHDEHWISRVASRGVWRDPEDRMMHYRRVLALTPLLRDQAFDIVHIQTPFVAHYAGLNLARQFGIPTLASYHTFFEEYLGCYVPLLPASLLRALARGVSASQCNAVDALVSPSWAMRNRLIEYGVKTEIRVIPTGIDPGMFRGGNGLRFRALHGIPANRPVLLYTGRVAHEKNIDFLFEVVAQARRSRPDLLLLVAGEGPAEGHLHALARRLGIDDHVLFVGYLDREKGLPDCYAAADVFVFASRTETQGLVLLEAMASGLPVVAHALMGTRDVLRDGMGALVATDGDVGEFCARVLLLLDNPEVRREQRQRALEYAAGWSNDHCARKLADYYRETIENHEIPVTARGRMQRKQGTT